MVTLYKFIPQWGLPDFSPFCFKVETYLRMAAIPFRTAVADSRKAPKHKLPYIDDGGAIISDSRDIIAHFEAKLAEPVDAGLSAADRANSTAFRALLEEELYYYVVYLRWKDDAAWKRYRPTIMKYAAKLGIPRFATPMVSTMVRKQMLQALWGQGIGRHTHEQIDDRVCEVVDAVATQLGDGPYFLGVERRVIDATVHAFMASLLEAPFDSKGRRHAQSIGKLVVYTHRMRDELWGADGA